MLTSGRDAEAVEALGTRLFDAVQQHNLLVSIGVAIAESGVSIAAALHDADARMYSMKRLHHARS